MESFSSKSDNEKPFRNMKDSNNIQNSYFVESDPFEEVKSDNGK